MKQILARKGKKPKQRDDEDAGKILLRVFCHAHGQRIILLVGGYDKGERPSHTHQQQQIALARSRLKSWKARQRPAKGVRGGSLRYGV